MVGGRSLTFWTGTGAQVQDYVEGMSDATLGPIVAADFFTVEVWTTKGLQRFIVLFLIELSSRRVEIGGISDAANGLPMTQIACNLTDSVDGLLAGKRYLIHDRDPLFTDELPNFCVR